MPFQQPGDTGSWLRRSPMSRDDGGGGEPVLRLVCFPHAGGGASSFNGWRQLLPETVDLLRVQLPGREDNYSRPPFDRTTELVPALVPHLESLFDRPVAFYGHSLGAIAAFEAIRELRRRGRPLPAVLFVSGRRAPQLPLSHPPYCLAPEEQLLEYLRAMGGTPEVVLSKPRWRDHLFPMLRADLKVSDLYSYTPEQPLPCPIYFFAGADDSFLKRHEWEGWGAQTTAEFHLRVLRGGHFFDRDEQATMVGDIVEFLGRRLGQTILSRAPETAAAAAAPAILAG
jgi:medium-chain acyl-[acyl-carrier-protein] hydrolase